MRLEEVASLRAVAVQLGVEPNRIEAGEPLEAGADGQQSAENGQIVDGLVNHRAEGVVVDAKQHSDWRVQPLATDVVRVVHATRHEGDPCDVGPRGTWASGSWSPRHPPIRARWPSASATATELRELAGEADGANLDLGSSLLSGLRSLTRRTWTAGDLRANAEIAKGELSRRRDYAETAILRSVSVRTWRSRNASWSQTTASCSGPS